MSQIKHVLWTGGWDSTFRIIQLYRLNATIQPLYVVNDERVSTKRELEAIEKITKGIQTQFIQSKGEILPLQIIKKQNIPSNILIKKIHKHLRRKVKLGKQYYWLACLAKKYKSKNLELSLHKEDLDKFFVKEQLIEFKDEHLGSNWKINPKKVGFFKRQLFSNMVFPLIDISKIEMKAVSEKNGFYNLMELTWFCHNSDKKPCGDCPPCRQYVRDGFGFRLQ
ncbi:7-cyano-7-deazaguanine synthase [uncultured Algibacter sp.]|uniref:7-cyano-7-deazaguanine synthase n=1 Tax=uncultured Algibacter sp. TaxID=298659 RepID=UPI0026053670|nr:7-cyano-7-deazaguanine synthase [uncultured Algibacter sp.]